MADSIDQRLRKRISLQSKLQTRTFANDILIAASARELGAIILTENSADFSIIASALDIRFSQPKDIFELVDA
jgi:predicted nucleic acid-binding protein